MDLIDEKWVEMNGKIIPIMKLERIVAEKLDVCSKWHWYYLTNKDAVDRDRRLQRWLKMLTKAFDRVTSLMIIRNTSSSYPSPCRMKIDSTA
ncbi:hypothetical protein MKW92_032928, partial [Papaver armeniacum]